MKKQKAHANPAFDRDIAAITALLSEMEGIVADQMSAVSAAFEEMDLTKARLVRKKDITINNKLEELEHRVMTSIARHQPVADDLRRIVGAMKMGIEYERMGDYVKHFAKSVGKFVVHHETLDVFPLLSDMEKSSRKMFADFRAARAAGDLAAMEKVWLYDQKIDDACHAAVQEAFSNQMRGDGNAHSLVQAVSVAKNLERLCDKIKNLVEIYYHQETGEALDLEVDAD